MATAGQEALTLEEFRLLADRAGLRLGAEEAEKLEPLYELYLGYVRQVHSLDLSNEALGVTFHPDVLPGKLDLPDYGVAGAPQLSDNATHTGSLLAEAKAASTESDLCYLTIREAGHLLRRRELSPVELVRAFLARIEAVDGLLHSFITVCGEEALAGARSAEAEILRGNYRGPLHGIPIGLKDVYETAGIRTTAGSALDMYRVPAEDATAYARLKKAGAILLGKMATYEYHMGGPSFDSPFPPCRNPWNLDHIPGGSSTGSGAAVAAGLLMGAMGSDTGGSVRLPASICGIVGLKPTYGRISRFGVVPLSWTLDHCGTMTWTVEDNALMLQVLAGHDPKDPTTSPSPVPDYSQALTEDIKGLAIGVPRHFFVTPQVNPEVVSRVEEGLKALQGLGAKVAEVNIPSLDYSRPANSIITLSESYAYHEPNLKGRSKEYLEITRSRFRIGALLHASDYVQAQRCRHWVKRGLGETLRRVDVLVLPVAAQPGVAFKNFDPRYPFRDPSLTSAFNLTGLPAISVPCGFTAGGLPVGMQIVGKPFDEVTLLRLAYAYQQHAGWSRRRPPI